MSQIRRIVVVFLAIGLVGCSFQKDKAPEDLGTASNKQLTSFAGLQTGIFQPKCARCHGGPTGDGGVDLSSYQAIMAGRGLVLAGTPSRSLIYTEVEDGSMPEGGPKLADTEIKAISDWILAGAPNGDFASAPDGNTGNPNLPPPVQPPPVTPPPVTPPPPTGVKYAQVQTRVFNQYCIQCHGVNKPKAGVGLSSYAALVASKKKDLVVAGMADRSLVYSEIVRGSMPPRGTVAAADLAVLRDWINQGALNQ